MGGVIDMPRRRMGAHGTINEWTDGKTRLTIRPEVRAFTVEDVAAIIGSAHELIPDKHRYDVWRPDNDVPQTYEETWQRIMEENLTKKSMMRTLTDCWFIANYEEWTDGAIRIDLSDDNVESESHRAMVDFIKMKFPKFMTTEEYNTAVH